ncbi:unnamed protein product [Closterium sp. NIES-54]
MPARPAAQRAPQPCAQARPAAQRAGASHCEARQCAPLLSTPAHPTTLKAPARPAAQRAAAAHAATAALCLAEQRWIRATRCQLRERFRQDLPVLRLHSYRGGAFSSGLLEEFCRDEGICQTFTLPASPQQNGIPERRIGLIMEVARTSMNHAAAPHFLWPFAVRYAAHQLNLWPRVSEPETSLTLRWTRKVGDASVFRPAAVDSGAKNAGAKPGGAKTEGEGSGGAATGGAGSGGAATGGAVSEVADPGGAASPSGGGAAGDPAGGPGAGQPSHPDLLETLSPQAIRAWIVRRGSPGGGGYDPDGSGATSPGDTAGAEGVGGIAGGVGGAAGAVGTRAASLGGAGGAACVECAEATSPRGATGAGGAGAACPGGPAGAGGAGAAGTGGAGAAGAGGAGGAAGAGGAGAGGIGGIGAASPGGARTGGVGAAGAGGATGAGGAAGGTGGNGGARAGGAGGTASARGSGTAGARGADGVGGATGCAGAGGAGGASAGGARATSTAPRLPFFYPQLQSSLPPPDSVLRQVFSLPSSTGLTPPLMCPPTDQSQPQLLPGSQLSARAPHTEVTESLTERHEPETRASTPVRARRVARPRPPAVIGTQSMALCPSSVPQRVVLPEPPASSLLHVLDPEFDLDRAASPTDTCLLATVVTDPDFESTAAFALVTELADFAPRSRLDYVASLITESESDCPSSVGGEPALSTAILEDR